MIEQIGYAILLVSGLLFIVFCLVEYVIWQDEKDCTHPNKTTFDSYHKQVCIDCGAEFSTDDV